MRRKKKKYTKIVFRISNNRFDMGEFLRAARKDKKKAIEDLLYLILELEEEE